MRVAVIGCRDVPDYGILNEEIKTRLPQGCSEIVSGGAGGVDTAAKIISKELNIPYTGIEPDYNQYGQSAPLIRNTKIVKYADFVIAFWDYRSSGTRYTIGEAIRLGRQMVIVPL